jgi:hypothetical protein
MRPTRSAARFDEDGRLDSGEIGRFAGVTVELRLTAGTVIDTVATDAAGTYSFTNLPDDTYVVDVTDTGNVLAGYVHSIGPSPGADNNSQADPYSVAVSGGETNSTGDFGYYDDGGGDDEPASLGDFVWNDLNANGIQNTGEPGVSGVGVTLYNAASVAVRTTTTSVAGQYRFTNLVPGVYHVGFTLPAGFSISPQDQGGDNARDSDVSATTRRTVPTTLVAGENDLTWDMGMYRPASLGDFAWNDINGNGIQDSGELGVSGVGVTLYNAASVAVRTTTTSVAGQYRFTNLVPGVYHVGFTLPAGFSISPQDQGGDDAKDSDVNAATRRTIPTTLVSGENDLTWDIGLIPGLPLLAVIGNVDAFRRDGQTIVRWETIESWDTAGFWLERQVGDEWLRISPEMIPYPLFAPSPIIYEEVDPGAEVGGTYVYRLVEMENDGDILFYGPYTLTVDGPGRTYEDWAAANFTAEELANPAISGREADPDGDRLSNWQEFLAGTDPNRADSVLQISDVRRIEGGFELRWKSVPGRYYKIAVADSMLGPFLPLEDSILATEETGMATLSVDFSERQIYFLVITDGIQADK